MSCVCKYTNLNGVSINYSTNTKKTDIKWFYYIHEWTVEYVSSLEPNLSAINFNPCPRNFPVELQQNFQRDETTSKRTIRVGQKLKSEDDAIESSDQLNVTQTVNYSAVQKSHRSNAKLISTNAALDKYYHKERPNRLPPERQRGWGEWGGGWQNTPPHLKTIPRYNYYCLPKFIWAEMTCQMSPKLLWQGDQRDVTGQTLGNYSEPPLIQICNSRRNKALLCLPKGLCNAVVPPENPAGSTVPPLSYPTPKLPPHPPGGWKIPGWRRPIRCPGSPRLRGPLPCDSNPISQLSK